MAVGLVLLCSALASAAPNVPLGERGELPKDKSGKTLNTDFEKGTLEDWTATGSAFDGQPIKGPIDKNRPFGGDKVANHTGDYWIGGYEKLRDPPKGTLTSAKFVVSQPFASFLLAGGHHQETRVELVQAEGDKVLFTASGTDTETLRPVIVDLSPQVGKEIYIRLVDESAEGWGHINFDDFRLHKERPKFPPGSEPLAPPPPVKSLYPNANIDAETAARVMELPKGFKATAAAAEPDVINPIAMCFDERGRLWVAQGLTYPIRAAEGKGRDSILIFEDTKGTGRLDKRTVFAENLNLVSGIEVGYGGVWVGAAPQLLFIPDANHDDKPDGPPQVVLDGWGLHDTHEVLNAFNWGPDGWLYGCHGVFTHSRVGKPGTPDNERTPINAGIWRYHPTQKKFEVFAHGTSNPWGVDFNDRGDAFCTACVIPHLFHIIQGGRYERQGGQHFNPFTYDDIKTIADHRHFLGGQWTDADRLRSDDLGGGHAHCGAMIYLGGGWPEKYRDQIFMHNVHGNRTNMDLLKPEGSGYVGSHGPDFLLSRDQWSQMLNLRYGPDGQVWMIDWYDGNQCHVPNPKVHDFQKGRIFRISYGDAENKPVDLGAYAERELAELTFLGNDWYVRQARRLLAERAAAGKPMDEARKRLVEFATTSLDERVRLRGLWALHTTGGVPVEVADKALADSNPHVRGWMVQLLCEDTEHPPSESRLARFAEMAAKDVSPVVRRFLASSLQRLPLQARWAIAGGLVAHPEDAADHNLPLLIWYGVEPLVPSDKVRALKLAATSKIPLVRQNIARRASEK